MEHEVAAARYFDGKTSRAHRVEVRVQDGMLHLSGEAERACPLGQLRVSERSTHAVRKVTFDDGAYLEAVDRAAFDRLLHASGHGDSWVVRAQQSWRGTALAVVATVALLGVVYLYGLPAASTVVARHLPVQAERMLGTGMLEMLDRHAFVQSDLPAARQAALRTAFAGLRSPEPGAPAYRLLFRKSNIGPNAFALPSGDIVLTDELAELLPDDGAVMAVLAHELGHLHERHLTRRVIQGSAVAAVTTLVFGDASAIIAGVPALLLDLRYSRDAERDADDYAAAMLRHNGLPLTHLEHVFEVLEKLDKNASGYLSSHPITSERLARLRNARP
ncbi:M48 family metallopeptidase [Massilia sp. BJB1822]|uniref:M48 family metallopeptidase n=1 Tax=Massilia sp. BJB1822 TaxID=2744470 RepID=UPI0015939491|nr:M48 family metallopeptidase [Massilia sp. BJB1822]NVD98982.1 M48 family metallopeptidase [Massilia sp. BJB1822]